MAKKQNNTTRATEYFKRYQGVKAVHFTSDGQAFTDADAAEAHQATLKQKGAAIETIHRSPQLAKNAKEIAALEQAIKEKREALLDAAGNDKITLKGEIDVLEQKLNKLNK